MQVFEETMNEAQYVAALTLRRPYRTARLNFLAVATNFLLLCYLLLCMGYKMGELSDDKALSAQYEDEFSFGSVLMTVLTALVVVGGVILVSHDQYFVGRVAKEVWLVSKGAAPAPRGRPGACGTRRAGSRSRPRGNARRTGRRRRAGRTRAAAAPDAHTARSRE